MSGSKIAAAASVGVLLDSSIVPVTETTTKREYTEEPGTGDMQLTIASLDLTKIAMKATQQTPIADVKTSAGQVRDVFVSYSIISCRRVTDFFLTV